MKQSKSLYTRVNNRLSFIVNSSLRKFGYGNRILAPVWDEQYANGRWSYLGETEEAEHYALISRFYAKYTPGGASLDIGCGHGLLYKHMSEQAGFNKDTYRGIDISGVAIEQAKEAYPGIRFEVVDFDKEKVPAVFDAIIFNETLYYFTSTAGTLRKCATQNLTRDGVFIISIYDYPGHDKLWEKVDKICRTLDEEVVGNNRGQKWKVKVMQLIHNN